MRETRRSLLEVLRRHVQLVLARLIYWPVPISLDAYNIRSVMIGIENKI